MKWDAIRMLVLDVDGVLTDGRIIIDDRGVEQKQFDVRDGTGVKYWRRAGFASAIITGRQSEVVVRRAAELGITDVRQGALNKLAAYEALLAECGLTDAEVAAIGDDLPDLPILRRAAFSAAVADAVPEVRRAALYVTAQPGGRGAVREVIEKLLRLKGVWPEILARYER
jgi:3-deoxy-D-manno-octulosonate 8-phosphate phosphatase (KDO 8-P phosphatase)